MGDVKSKYKLPMSPKSQVHYTPVEEFEFHDLLDEDSNNGLCLNNIYVPKEVLENILGHIPPEYLLNLTLVCKTWCNIIKSDSFWKTIFNRNQPTNKSQLLPWYVYYSYLTTNNFKNLLKNGNGQDKFKYWKIIKNYGDQFVIEKTPKGADPLPENVHEFYGQKCCFATSYVECNKLQEILLRDKRLLRYILRKFNLPVYASEWTASRFDCGSNYYLKLAGYNELYYSNLPREHTELSGGDEEYSSYDSDEDIPPIPLFEKSEMVTVQQWEGAKWKKVEIVVSQSCPPDLAVLVFEHQGRDTQFWKGHYGSKMAGGVVKFLINGIEPRKEDTSESSSVHNQKK